MPKNIILFVFLNAFIFIFSLGFSSASESQEKPKIILKGSFTQGSVLFMEISGLSENSGGTVRFRDASYSLQYANNALATTIPISLDCPQGSYLLSAEISSGESVFNIERTINVSAHTYGVQRLWLSESQLASYDDPQANADNDAILAALKLCDKGEIAWHKKFICPLSGYISTAFGLKRFYNEDVTPEFHKGVDIAGVKGEIVSAPQNGIVLMAKENLPLHGGVVVLNHSRGLGTIYLHLDSVSVSKGEYVKQGDEIGRVGNKGVSTGAHLHWAAYSHGTPVNPWQLLTLPASWLEP